MRFDRFTGCSIPLKFGRKIVRDARFARLKRPSYTDTSCEYRRFSDIPSRIGISETIVERNLVVEGNHLVVEIVRPFAVIIYRRKKDSVELERCSRRQ